MPKCYGPNSTGWNILCLKSPPCVSFADASNASHLVKKVLLFFIMLYIPAACRNFRLERGGFKG